MARHLGNLQIESVASYMDGVLVKISDNYKIPQIVKPEPYYAELPDTSKYIYDFSFEKKVTEKMKEWKKARSLYIEARKERMQEKKKKESETTPPSSPCNHVGKHLPIKVAPAPKSTILTPQPLTQTVNHCQNYIKSNGLDYSDFDNDTSSPFDNMELKTINEMEELAQVLQPTTPKWDSLGVDSKVTSDLQMTDCTPQENENIRDKCAKEKHKTISIIVQDLHRELDKSNVEKFITHRTDSKKSSRKRSKGKSLSNPQIDSTKLLRSLSNEDQALAKSLSDMGFPLPRVVHALCDLKGQDNKKIVEYLLSVQSLVDLNVPEEEAIKSLALTQNDKHKAKVYYDNLCTLRDLGFPEDRASAALLKCNIDRDSALDMLIA